jgi:hypothetical protein
MLCAPAGPLSSDVFTCPSGQTLVLASVSYTSVVLTETTNGVAATLADVSRTFNVPCDPSRTLLDNSSPDTAMRISGEPCGWTSRWPLRPESRHTASRHTGAELTPGFAQMRAPAPRARDRSGRPAVVAQAGIGAFAIADRSERQPIIGPRARSSSEVATGSTAMPTTARRARAGAPAAPPLAMSGEGRYLVPRPCFALAEGTRASPGRSRTSSSPEVLAVLPVCGTSSTVGVADPQAVPQPK